jgi:hypothetical protein
LRSRVFAHCWPRFAELVPGKPLHEDPALFSVPIRMDTRVDNGRYGDRGAAPHVVHCFDLSLDPEAGTPLPNRVGRLEGESSIRRVETGACGLHRSRRQGRLERKQRAESEVVMEA